MLPRNSSSLGRRKQLPCFQNAIQQNGHSSLLKSYMSARFEASHDLYRTDLRGHYGCVNAIEFSNLGGEFVVSGKRNVLFSTLLLISKYFVVYLHSVVCVKMLGLWRLQDFSKLCLNKKLNQISICILY